MIKIYSGIFDTTPIDTIETYFDAEIQEDINGVSSLKITVKNEVTGLKRLQKIQFFEIQNWEDVVLFEWYISELKPGLNNLEIESKDFRQLFQKKMCIENYTFTSETLHNIINTIVDDWNNTYWESWTVNINLTGTLSKDFKQWDNFYDIFYELSESLLGMWNVKWNEIFFGEIIWEDKSVWEKFTEIIYNKNEPVENNLSEIKRINYSTIANIIFGTDGTTTTIKTNPTSISEFWPLAEYKNFREWDLSENTQAYLDIKSQEQFIYDITPDINSIDVDLWDKIYLRVENVSEYLNIDGSVIVNTKNTRIINGTKVIELWLSEIYVTRDNFIKRINDTKKTINLLKIT